MQLELIERNAQGNDDSTPILFVHGAWHGAWCWDEFFLPYFAQNGFPSYALSFRGHGRSEVPAHFKWQRVHHYVEDLAETVSKLPQSPVLVGHSMGGLVVQKYLEQHKAPGAVLLASVPVRGALATTLRIAGRHPWAFVQANLSWSLYPIIGSIELARELFFSKEFSQEKLGEYYSQMQDEAFSAFLDMIVFDLPNPAKVDCDMLVLGGEKDNIFTPGEIRATAEAYGMEAEIFPGMAHNMMLEPQWQKVADRILSWLRK